VNEKVSKKEREEGGGGGREGPVRRERVEEGVGRLGREEKGEERKGS